MDIPELKETIQNLPNEPGIYQYYDKTAKLIYVGKAKNIKKRVSSYFSKVHFDNKTRVLVSQIAKIEFIVVNSESDALLLENNLIKTNQPKYNILLRDDKTYPYILLTNDRFPKIYATRTYKPEKGTYYGPFSSVRAMDTVMELIKKIFTIRNCDLNLTELSISKQKFKKCLEYHLGNCKAPCEALQEEPDYNKDIDQIKIILKGDLSLIKRTFTERMKQYAASLDFERAEKEKNKIEYLEKFQSNTLITGNNINDTMVFTINVFDNKYYVNFIEISFGRIIKSKTVEVLKALEETEEEILCSSITQIINDLYENPPKEILTNKLINLDYDRIQTSVPLRGDKKKLIDLSLKNIDYYLQNKVLKEKKEPQGLRVLQVLQRELSLKDLPTHIECFDNSNLQGTDAVAAMVCFKNGVPSKKDYRHYNIKTVEGPNDFDSMKEIVFRRYSRLLEEEQELPKLIIVDGGKGQLSSAVESLKKLNIYGVIPIISIAKRLEEIYIPEDTLPLLIKKNSEGLRLIQQMRDEAHRFGITFHRKKRDKIKGVK